MDLMFKENWKIGFDFSYKLYPYKTICMKCRILFSRKNKEKLMDLLFAEC